MNVERLGIIFTVAFVSFMLVIIQLLLSKFSTNERILASVITALVISIMAFISYRKKLPTTHPLKLTNRCYLLYFISGAVLGLFISIGIEIAYGIDYQNAEPVSFYYGIPLALGGYAGFYFFTIMAMAVSIIHIPYIKSKIPGDSVLVPCIRGATFGFGIVILSQLFLYGIPKLF